MQTANRNRLQEIITRAIEEIKKAQGDNFNLQNINPIELHRRINISHSTLHRLKKNGSKVKTHATTSRKVKETVLSGYTGVIDDLFRQGVTNSKVCYRQIYGLGYFGGKTSIKSTLRNRNSLFLLHTPHQIVSNTPQRNRGFKLRTLHKSYTKSPQGFKNVMTSSRLLPLLR